jgi:hypothetical protein
LSKNSPQDTDLEQTLHGNFVVVNLGSGSDRDYLIPDRLKRLMTVVEVDAADESGIQAHYYFKRISLKKGIAPQAGRYSFRLNKFVGCSSILSPKIELIRRYGLEKYYEVERLIEIDCETLPSVLERLDLPRVDFLKTDLEGLDYPVIKSCEPLLDKMLAIQCELRFEPFYEGEPFFHEVCAFLYSRDFELIDLKPQHWMPNTTHRRKHRDGRIVWADCLFLRNLERTVDGGTREFTVSLAKQIIICSFLGLKSYGEFLLERYEPQLDAHWVPELEPLVQPGRRDWKSVIKSTQVARMLMRLRQAWSCRPFDFAHVVER